MNIATVNALDKVIEKLLASEPFSLQLRHQKAPEIVQQFRQSMWPTMCMSLSFLLMK